MSSGFNTHWCHNCVQPVRPYDGSLLCPYCDAEFLQDLNEIGGPISASLQIQLSDNFDTQGRFLDVYSATNEGNSNSGGGLYNELLNAGDPYATEDEGNNGFGGNSPGSEVEDLIQQLSLNDDSSGPLPAPSWAINALPSVKINKKHVRCDLHCSICMEKFVLGAKALQMPCMHLYHSGCIVTWLTQHNSCPVCRSILSAGDGQQGRKNPLSHFCSLHSRRR